MPLTESQLQELSSLIDTLQGLPEERRASWLNALSVEQAVYRPTLERLLSEEAQVETVGFLHTLPKIDNVAQACSDTLVAGAEVGPYRLLQELGRGGMGAVWLAKRTDASLKRSVALKLPHSTLAQRQLAERFARERDILAALTHPNIARLYDAGVTSQGQPYLAMEYVQGLPLPTACDRRCLGVRSRIELYLQVLSAVQYAHSQLVVHRDLKPSNILVTEQGDVRLLDFGIARLMVDGQTSESELTQVGARAMTPQYASPEQFSGAVIGTASDVYSLGVVLFELLTGILPYRLKRDSHGALEDAVLLGEPESPSQAVRGVPSLAAARGTTNAQLVRELKGDLDTIVLKALKKSPAERYATAEAFAADLRRYLAGDPVHARPDSRWYRFVKGVGRNRLAVSAALAVVVALAIGLGVALWQTGVAREQARLAREEARTTQAVHDFMTDIFKANSSNQADPKKARETTARELLDIGAAKIDTSLKDAPQARAAVLRLVSDMYAELGLNERAAQLAEQRVELLRTLLGRDALEVADQLVEVSQMTQSTERSSERGVLLGEALRILQLHPESDLNTRVRVLRQLALFENDFRDPAARVHAQQAVDLSAANGTPNDLIDALLVLGKVQGNLDDNVGAEKTLQRAVALVATTPDFHARQRILLTAYLGDAQFALGQIEPAEKNFRQALALAFKLSGAEHLDVAQMELRLGELLFESARSDEGLRLVESAHARVVRLRGPNNSSLLPSVLRVESALHAERAEWQTALVLAQNALHLLATGNPSRKLTSLMLLAASVTAELGDATSARAALSQLDQHLLSVKAIEAQEAEQRALLEVRVVLLEKRTEEARALFQQKKPASDAARKSFASWRLWLQWAELALGLGEPQTALAMANRVLQQVAADQMPQYLAAREARAKAIVSKARQALKQ